MKISNDKLEIFSEFYVSSGRNNWCWITRTYENMQTGDWKRLNNWKILEVEKKFKDTATTLFQLDFEAIKSDNSINK